MKTDIRTRRLKCQPLLWFIIFLWILGCSDSDQKASVSLPTRGELVIGIDESLRPFAEAEIEMFSVYYPDAHVSPLYLPEKQVVEKLLDNEIQTAIICRDLYQDESSYISGSYSHETKTFKLAYDAIVAVANKVNPVSTISLGDLKGILSGKVTDWAQLSESNKNDSPIIVILTGSSSIDRYFSSSAPLSPAATYALDTTSQVIDYVKKNDSAIGIVGGSWFYRKGSENSDVKILTYLKGPTEEGSGEGRPSREVYAVTHEPNTGLGSGLISFMAGQKGQLIIYKAGMTPYKRLERKVKISGSFPE